VVAFGRLVQKQERYRYICTKGETTNKTPKKTDETKETGTYVQTEKQQTKHPKKHR